jgi:hypothetical protein
MCELLAFRKIGSRLSRQREAIEVDAEIIFFPGVRYERMTEPKTPPKQRRPTKRRSPETEKAS